MIRRPIVMYIGGFAKIGGIEAFARDFLLSIAGTYPERELVMWGKREGNRLLDEIANSGATISSVAWRWGCRWNLPDYFLLPAGLAAVRRAAAVIFKRPPPASILQRLREASRATGRRIPFVLITPYRPLEYWGENPALSHFESYEVIITQSEDGVNDLRKAGYRGRIENIPYLPPVAARPVAFPSSREKETIRFGFLGRLAPQKNLRYLLEVFEVLSRTAKGRYELHLFGEGNDREMLERICAERSLFIVVFHGETPREEVSRAIDSCDIFLNTSLTEGQCLVALEVLSRGRPLVATPVGALPEVLAGDELGKLAPLGDAKAFAGIVMEVVEAIQTGRMTPESVSAAFTARYDHDAILGRYLKLLAEEISE